MKELKTKLIEHLLDDYTYEEAEDSVNNAVIVIKGSYLYVCYTTGKVDTYSYDHYGRIFFVS